MKKIAFFAFALLFSSALFAQDTTLDDTTEKKNEVKLNALIMVIGAFDVTYERLLNEESGVGLTIFVPFDEDVSDDINYYISPYYRLYFGKKYAAGFFIEGFGLLSSVNRIENFVTGSEFDLTFNSREVTATDFALGVGVGGKWVTKSGFLGELNLGVGRNVFSSKDNDGLVAKLGVTVGYRF